jgi:predicted phosphodiesterase
LVQIALISDIHGNLPALDAVLAEIERAGVNQIVCLGDVAATGPQPHEVLVRLREVGCPVVLGNADAELLSEPPRRDPDTDEGKLDELIRWGTAQLDAADLAYLRSLPPTISVALEPDGAELLCVHGSPRNFNDIIRATTPAAEIEPMLGLDDHCPAVIAGGHTHVAMLRSHRATLLVNPGSVGRPYEEWPDGRTIVPAYVAYAILSVTPERQSIAFHRVGYDQAVTIRAMHERTMPFTEWLASDWQTVLEQP